MQSSPEEYSPRWFASRLDFHLENFHLKLVQWTQNWRQLCNAGIGFLFLALAFCYPLILRQYGLLLNETDFLLLNAILLYGKVLALTMAFGSVAFYIHSSKLPFLQLAGFLVSLAMAFLFLPQAAGVTALGMTANYVAAFAVFLLFFGLGSWKGRGYLFPGDFFLASYLTYVAGFIVNFRLWFNMAIIDFPRMIFPFSYLSLEAQAKRRSSRLVEMATIFSPTILFTPLPIEAKDRVFTQDWSFRLRGFRDVLRGILFLILAIFIKSQFLSVPAQGNAFEIFVYGFFYYAYYFLGSYAWMALPFGILRWYGMRLPDFFDHPLLAASPADRWRRWNTYYYNWYYKVLFFPLFKKSKSILLALIVVFFFTFLFHAGRLSYGPLLANEQLLRHPLTTQLAIFFSAHALLVFFSLKFPRLWPSDHSKSGWWGVLMVTLLMSLVHIYAV